MAISRFIPALLLACTAALSAQSGNPGRRAPAVDADDLKIAEQLLQQQQYPQAEQKLLAAVRQQESNPQAWFDLGFAQSRLGKGADSISAYRKAVELSPKWFEAQQNLGLALAKSGDLAGAAVALRTAVTLKPTSGGQQALGRAWAALAQVTEDAQPQEALSAYQKAVQLDPADSAAIDGLGRLLERSGDIAGAEQQFLKLAESGNADGMERLVALYVRQKRFNDAEAWLRKYLATSPGDPAAQIQFAKVLASQGKTQDAIAALETVYKSAKDPRIARALAGLYLESKQYGPAAQLLEGLAAANPGNAQLHLDLGSALAHQHKYPEAQAELLKAVQLDPKLTDAYFDLAYSAQQTKSYELAIRALDARARLQPDTPATYFLRATAYDSLRMYKPAAENYKLFLAAAGGKFPDQEFQARHRLKAIEPN